MGNMQQRLKMKDLPTGERPYEKLEKLGPQVLSDAELLAIIIKTGSRNETSVALAQRLLTVDTSDKGLNFLYDLSLEQLRNINGIGKVKAVQIKALMELSKRIASSYTTTDRAVIKSPDDVKVLLMEEMRHQKKEIFKIILLSTKNHVIRAVDVSVGSLTASIVHPREVFSEAIKAGCSAMILVHNHPSGDPEPSNEDIDTTKRLVQGGNILGIKILDHIIIGDGKYVSLKERGLL